MDLVEINNLHVRTEVGFSPHEIGKLQELIITIQMKTTRKAGNNDCIKDVINLKTVTKEIMFHVENKKYNLIEAVASDVARICVVRHGVQCVVNVKKPNALRFSKYSSVTIERFMDDFEWNEVHVSIGSNIKPLQNIPKALDMLKEKTEVLEMSQAFRTAPVGFKEQEDFVNMAVVLKTKLGPEGLKIFFTDIEQRLGRIRDAKNKNAPRTIDLDISFWGDSVLDYKTQRDSKIKTSSIPDPEILKHSHVIIPLADVTPEFIHPVRKQPLRMIAADVCGTKMFASFFPIVQLDELLSFPDGRLMSPTFVRQNGYERNSSVIFDAVPKPLKTVGPVALITGAAKRLGAAIARQLHTAGYNIMIHYNTSEAQASALANELNGIRIDSARMVQADLSSDLKLTAEKVVKECTQVWGRLDVLVNNASQFNPTEVGTVDEKEWNNLIQTNLAAPFFLSQAAYPSLKSSRGCIINMLDIHANRPLTSHSVYCISKAGLQMCTLALAKDFAPDVRVNGVAPGAILWKEGEEGNSGPEAVEAKHDEVLKKVPVGRRGEPSDIATMVEFLVCNAGYVTGQVVSVDGGRTLNQ